MLSSSCSPTRGKHLPTYTPSMDMGAYVIVINAEQVTVTGTKADDKLYFRHVNGRPGSWKSETFNQLQRVSDRGEGDTSGTLGQGWEEGVSTLG